MSSSLGTLTLDLIAKIGGFTQPLGQAERQAAKTAQKIAAQQKSIQDSVSKTNAVMANMGKNLFAAAGAAGLVRSIVSVNKEFDRLQASLETVMKSKAGADAAFATIQDFAKTTPYQLAEVTDAFVKLKAMGLDASMGTLKSYGNTASAMGKSLNQMIEAVADAGTGEFERLKEFGIKAKQEGDKVTFTFQGVSTTVGKNAAEIQNYLLGIGNTQFAGGMARQMETLGGKMSNLEDAWSALMRAVGDSGVTAGITSGLEAATAAIEGLPSKIGAVTDGLVSLAKITVVGGALFYMPGVLAAVAVAVQTLRVQMALAKMEMVGATVAARAWALVVGTEAVTATWAAAGAMQRLAIVGQGVFAGFVGWEIGKWVEKHCEKARQAMVALIGTMDMVWTSARVGFATTLSTVKAGAKLDFTGAVAEAQKGWSTYKKEMDRIAIQTADVIDDVSDKARAKAKAKAAPAMPEIPALPAATGGGGGKEKTDLKALKALKAEGARLAENLRTPLETLTAKQAEYNGMLKAGAISQETFNRAVKAAQDEYARATVDPAIQQIEALRLEAETSGMTTTKAALYRMEKEKVNPVLVEQARALYATIDAEKKKQELETEGARVTEQYRSGVQKVCDELKRLQELRAAGTISPETFGTAQKTEIGGAFSQAPAVSGLDGASGDLDRNDQERERLQSWYEEQLDLLEQFRQQRADLGAVWDEREKTVKQQHEAALAQIEKNRAQLQISAAGTMFGEMAEMTKTFAGEQSGAYRAMFAVSKAFAIAEAGVKLWQAIAIAGASTSWPANLAAMASVAAAMGGIVSQIASVGMAHDGIDQVPETGTWLLKKGERVVTEKTSAKLDRVLSQVQQAGRSGSGMTVNIHEAAGTSARVQQSADGAGLDVIIEKVERAITGRMDRGAGVAAFFDRRYGRQYA